MNSESFGYFVLCFAFLSSMVSHYLSYNRLQKYNVRLKMKLTDLALKTDNEIYAVYKVSDEDKTKIRSLKGQNNKIAAVKLLKDNYQMGLFEAKNYVDYL